MMIGSRARSSIEGQRGVVKGSTVGGGVDPCGICASGFHDVAGFGPHRSVAMLTESPSRGDALFSGANVNVLSRHCPQWIVVRRFVRPLRNDLHSITRYQVMRTILAHVAATGDDAGHP